MAAAGGGGAAGILGGIGQVVGGELAQQDASINSSIIPYLTPDQNPSLQAINFDALSQIGFGNANRLLQAGPMADLARQINALPIKHDVKRRALYWLQGGKGKGDNVLSINEALVPLGLTMDDLNRVRQEQADFEQRTSELQQFSQPIQDQIVRDRLSSSGNVANLLSQLSSGGDSRLQDQFRDQFIRDQQRGLNEAQEMIDLRAQFSGVNPADQLDQITQSRGDLFNDADLFSLRKAMEVASGVDAVLSRASQTAQNAAGLGLNASTNAAGIAANQATAANALRAAIVNANKNSRAEGVSGGISSLGSLFGPSAPAAGNSGGISSIGQGGASSGGFNFGLGF